MHRGDFAARGSRTQKRGLRAESGGLLAPEHGGAAPGAAQKEVTRWLNMLADFHVRVDQDKQAAAGALRRVMELYPKSAVAAQAEQRIAYLETEMLKNKKSHALKLGSYEDNLGL